ncbi:hypothetical protein [Hymenobacter properus]|uniref:Lipoprotein n=1 Tax=Hymenobacter properus TaxID=2791026 RepID=A0A931BM46_9BACT|nr:hypothetical protein [Hymenobacter properus]MBF9141970.1 hypothetical protein [Hymenobacter properus]MBR7720777.1 hypothetical protein [Microvirga sp. SRT04]
MFRLLTPLAAPLLGLALLTACHKENATPAAGNTLVFGSYYGECGGPNCIRIFRLDLAQQALAEDVADKYPSSSAPYQGQYVARSAANFRRVQGLLQQVPAQLLAERSTVIGQPDAGDWGGYYVEVRQAGIRRFWLIDTQKRNLPTYLHAFTDSLQANIRALR